jgi:5-methylcytosine-specific restriction enzyme A
MNGGKSGRSPRRSMLGNRTPELDTRSARPPAKIANPFYLTPEWRSLVAEIIRERGASCLLCPNCDY